MNVVRVHMRRGQIVFHLHQRIDDLPFAVSTPLAIYSRINTH